MAYDLFLSHNRQQKPWIRELAKFLRGLGLTVFFDEDSVNPGQDIALAIEQALETSRTVVLIISRSSLNSQWVSFEIAIRVYEDPLGVKKQLVPILAERVELSRLRPSVRRLDIVDLTDPNTRETEFIHFLRFLGVPDERCLPIQAWPEPIGIEELHIADINSVISAGWTGEQLLEILIRLDYEVFDDLVPSHEGVPRQWAPVFMNHPDTWRLLTTETKDVVGYWHFAPLFDEDFERAVHGRLLDSQITADKIRFFELPGWYDIYFVSIGLQAKYRRPKAIARLFESLLDVLRDLARCNIYIRNICANAYTQSGVALCKSLHMTYYREHEERGSIYTSTMRDLLKALPLKGKNEVVTIYSTSDSTP